MPKASAAQYAEDAAPPSNSQTAVQKLVQEQLTAEKRVEKAEEELKTAQKALRDIAEHRFPELIEELGLGERFKTASGHTVKLRTKLRGNITDERKGAAVAFLEKNGSSALVKRSFEILFDKSEEAWARKFQKDLSQRKKPLNCAITYGLHTGSVLSFLSELLEKGKNVPLEVFGAFHQKSVKIEPPKT